jgi:hypothetical protein
LLPFVGLTFTGCDVDVNDRPGKTEVEVKDKTPDVNVDVHEKKSGIDVDRDRDKKIEGEIKIDEK